MKYRLIASLLVVGLLCGLAFAFNDSTPRAATSPAAVNPDDSSMKSLRIE